MLLLSKNIILAYAQALCRYHPQKKDYNHNENYNLIWLIGCKKGLRNHLEGYRIIIYGLLVNFDKIYKMTASMGLSTIWVNGVGWRTPPSPMVTVYNLSKENYKIWFYLSNIKVFVI